MNRLKMVREKLGMSQTEFGEVLKMSTSAISRMEKGERGISDRLILQVSREFGVSEEWLKTGEGEMFIDTSDDIFIASLMGQIIAKDDRFMKNVIKTFNKLTEEQRTFLTKLMKDLSE